MADTVASVLTDIKDLLNDPNGDIYTQDPLIRVMNRTYREIQRSLRNHGIGTVSDVSAIIQVAAGTTELTDGGGLPSDLIQPLELFERASGSSDDWNPMDEKEWEPEIDQGTSLVYWVWREEAVRFVGATTNREVKMRYLKGLTALIDGGSVGIADCRDWLATRTAAVAAYVIGENESRSQALQLDAEVAKDEFLRTRIRAKQDMPIRRRVNRFRRGR